MFLNCDKNNASGICYGVIFSLLSLFLFCSPDDSDREKKKIFHDKPPEIKIGVMHWAQSHSKSEEKETINQINKILYRFINMVDSKNIRALPQLISKKRGLWIDLKSHRSYKRIEKEIRKNKGYLQQFYLDTELLREHTGDAESIAVRDVLRHSKFLRVDYYMESGGTECELKLFLIDYPDFNYHLNNPVFIKEEGKWMLYRLF